MTNKTKENVKKYSLSLSEDEWKLIINTLWLDHSFQLAENIENKLKKKHPKIHL